MSAPKVPTDPAGAASEVSSVRIDPALTVLMALWRGDRAQYAREALESATTKQTLRPAHLVLSIDGELPAELEAVVADVASGKFGPSTVVRSSEHSGLARTLARGIDRCTTTFIARADADDLNHADRFDKQLRAMREQGIDLIGSQMREIDAESKLRVDAHGEAIVRHRPTSHADIANYLRDHSPFHHPTVVMRAEALKRAGGYREFPYLEDYDLWHRMKVAGATMANVNEALVDYRVTDSLFVRRGGFTLFASDVRLQRAMLRSGSTSLIRALKNLVGRAVYRAIPARLRSKVYWLVIEKGLGRS